LIAAAQYFEREAENLGVDFIDFVQRTAARLVQFPASGRRVGRRLRRVVVPRFLFLLLYRVERLSESSSLLLRILAVVPAIGGHVHDRGAG